MNDGEVVLFASIKPKVLQQKEHEIAKGDQEGVGCSVDPLICLGLGLGHKCTCMQSLFAGCS